MAQQHAIKEPRHEIEKKIGRFTFTEEGTAPVTSLATFNQHSTFNSPGHLTRELRELLDHADRQLAAVQRLIAFVQDRELSQTGRKQHLLPRTQSSKTTSDLNLKCRLRASVVDLERRLALSMEENMLLQTKNVSMEQRWVEANSIVNS